MRNIIQGNPYSTLLSILALSVGVESVSWVIRGFDPSSSFYTLSIIFLMAGIRYFLILLCLAVTIRSILRHQLKHVFTLLWVFLAVVGQVPKWNLDTLGSLLSMYNARPEQVLEDARFLVNQYEPMSHFGNPQRDPLNHPLPVNRLPGSIQRVHIEDVLVMEDYVFIAKHGLQGVFRGFIAFREGRDPWKNEPRFVLQQNCSGCLRIRIIDGLYWYSANRSSPPIYTSPLK